MPDVEKKSLPTWLILLMLIIIVIGTVFVYLMVLINLMPDFQTRGQFGDMFGAINAVFSGLAFAAIVYAIFLQRRDIELQRRDLDLQRKELALTREEYKRMAEAQESSHELGIIAEQLQVCKYLFDTGKTLIESMQKQQLNENEQMAKMNMEVMVFSQAQKMGELINKLNDLQQRSNAEYQETENT